MKYFLSILIYLSIIYISVGQNVVQVEYFLDTDAGVGKNRVLNLASSPNENFPVAIDFSGVKAGYHLLYMRTRDDKGVWSQTSRKYVEVLPTGTQNVAVAGEYFFDQDPGAGTARTIVVSPQDSLVMQDFTAAVSGLSQGPHKMYIRMKDAYGRWSQTFRSTIEIVPVQIRNNLVAGEYYFDKDPGFGKGVGIVVSPQDSLVVQNFTALPAGLTPGPHTLYVRLTDSNGKWSQTMRRAIDVVKNADNSYIVSLEYFFKTDPGFGNANFVQLTAPLQNGEFRFDIPLDKITSSSDSIYVRVRDSSDNNWSFTTRRTRASGPLPLTLLTFTAAAQADAVQLNWQTQNEVNTAYFNVQRSTDGRSFINLGSVKAKGTSVPRSSYHYNDDIKGLSAEKLYYRLQQADIDGKNTYSDIVAVNNPHNSMQFTIMPNPASDYVTLIPANGITSNDATILITDMAGHTLIKQKLTNAGGQKISLSSLASGVYLVSVMSPGNVQTQKLVVK